jgi:lipoprotein-anchoring transpeptidase ErfK/SrfK
VVLSLRRRQAPDVAGSDVAVEFAPLRHEPDAEASPRSRTLARVLVLIGLLLFVAGAAYGYDRISADHYFPGTHIGGQLIGSQTVDVAEAVLHERFVVPLHRPVTITGPALRTEATPWDMGFRVDVGNIARSVLKEQHETPVLTRMWRRAAGVGSDASLHLSFDRAAVVKFADRFVKQVNRPPRDAEIRLKVGKLVIVPDQVGRHLTQQQAIDAIEGSLAKGARGIRLPVQLIQPSVRASAFSNVLVVSVTDNTLKLYERGKVTRQFGVSTGTGGYPTPIGLFTVVDKEEWPSWFNPHAPWSLGMPEVIGPGRNNPLGTRALYLSVSGILIHGTPHDYSIGTNASHGCIRMHISDSEALYPMIPVGTPVLIHY